MEFIKTALTQFTLSTDLVMFNRPVAFQLNILFGSTLNDEKTTLPETIETGVDIECKNLLTID